MGTNKMRTLSSRSVHPMLQAGKMGRAIMGFVECTSLCSRTLVRQLGEDVLWVLEGVLQVAG